MRRDKWNQYEIECVPGLESIVLDELLALDSRLNQARVARSGFLRFAGDGSVAKLHGLRSATALYQAHQFAVPRPKALLGHQHFTRLVKLLRRAFSHWSDPPASLGLGAAGANTPVMRRLKSELSRALCIPLAHDGKGQLFLRLARASDGDGWEALIRTTAKPLATRDWRLANLPGALNATVAYAMTALAPLDHEQALIVNLCSGSATIAIEHALGRSNDHIIAIDHSPSMHDAARQNIAASGTQRLIGLLQADAIGTPLPAKRVDRIYADLPFGAAIGSHADNLRLYPALLREAARIASANARCVLLTHEVNLLRRCLAGSGWRLIDERRINLSGLHPRIFVLKRNAVSM